MHTFRIILFLMCIYAELTIFTSFSSAETITPPSKAIPATLFGMHIHRAATVTPWPKVPFKTWRLWDANVAWPWLEPVKGNWNFRDLDKLVDLASRNNVVVLLPLGLSPSWASARPTEESAYKKKGYASEPQKIEDWRNYVRTVATRYKGRIKYYEIWNEPNLKGFYSGSNVQMVTLAREAYLILKEIDPTITVVSPAATGGSNGPAWLDEYFAKGGGNYADIIGYHFYVTPAPPEAMVSLINRIKLIMQKHNIVKQLWNTEAGWDKKKRFDTDEEAAAYVARSYILNWAAGVERFYWYAWDNNGWVSLRLTLDDYTQTAAASAYEVMQKWLVGAQMTSCMSDSNGIWTCKIIRDGGYAAWIIWSGDKSQQFNIPGKWGVETGRDLKGGRRVLKGITKVEVGPSPQLLENVGNAKLTSQQK